MRKCCSYNYINLLNEIIFSDELDSFMYQTVGHMGIEILAKAMGLPLYRQETKGKSTQTGKQYVPTDNDEVEDLYNLLALCKVSIVINNIYYLLDMFRMLKIFT